MILFKQIILLSNFIALEIKRNCTIKDIRVVDNILYFTFIDIDLVSYTLKIVYRFSVNPEEIIYEENFSKYVIVLEDKI